MKGGASAPRCSLISLHMSTTTKPPPKPRLPEGASKGERYLVDSMAINHRAQTRTMRALEKGAKALEQIDGSIQQISGAISEAAQANAQAIEGAKTDITTRIDVSDKRASARHARTTIFIAVTAALSLATLAVVCFVQWPLHKEATAATRALSTKVEGIERTVSGIGADARSARETAATALEGSNDMSEKTAHALELAAGAIERLDGSVRRIEGKLEEAAKSSSALAESVDKKLDGLRGEVKVELDKGKAEVLEAVAKASFSALPPLPPTDGDDGLMVVTGPFHEAVVSKGSWTRAFSKSELSVPGAVRIDRHPGILAAVYTGWPISRPETPIMVDPEGGEFALVVKSGNYRYVRFCLAPDAEETKPDGSPVIIRSIKKK